MLILTRHAAETLVIGDEITLTVVEVKGNHVRIGIRAPNDVAVHREEIYQRTQHNLDRPEFHRHSLAALRIAPFELYR